MRVAFASTTPAPAARRKEGKNEEGGKKQPPSNHPSLSQNITSIAAQLLFQTNVSLYDNKDEIIESERCYLLFYILYTYMHTRFWSRSGADCSVCTHTADSPLTSFLLSHLRMSVSRLADFVALCHISAFEHRRVSGWVTGRYFLVCRLSSVLAMSRL